MNGPRPIFVVGSPRSGTTLLQACLGAHSRIIGPPEMHYVMRIVSLADHYGDLGDDEQLRRALRDTLDQPLLADLQVDESAVFERARCGPRTYAGLFDAVMSHLAETAGKARWSDKTPAQPAGAAWRLFPDAQVVHIVRDPRDVVSSAIDAPFGPDDPAALARAWRRFNLGQIGDGAAAGPDRYHRVRYEDLVSDPHAVLRVVCAFLEEPFEEAMVAATDRAVSGAVPNVAMAWQGRARQPIDASSVGRHRRSLTRTQRAVIDAVTYRCLPSLGYAPAPRREVGIGAALLIARRPREIAQRMSRPRPSLELTTPSARRELIRDLINETIRGTAPSTRADGPAANRDPQDFEDRERGRP